MNMKPTVLATPILLIAMAAASFAQTETTGGNDTADGQQNQRMFGQNWSDSMGGALFSDDRRETLRGDDELTGAWDTMSEEDRQMLRDDCHMMGNSAGTDASTDSSATGGSATNTTGNDNDVSDDATGAMTSTGEAGTDSTSASTAGSTSASTSGAAGMASISAENMTHLCSVLGLN
ncbi:hypothetical protein [Frigidibacter sp. SD6-1]|uniref:hypothetical protein n=1 Tax=Frigidibacter sp. SD6-1 TaxID=3032581 RepID=UPI0024DFEB63|nr:hypothetical protein [Frigidibacter sp. SD6-1]